MLSDPPATFLSRLLATVAVVWGMLVLPARAAERVATAGPLCGGQPPQRLSLDVRGMSSLSLTATGYSWGQAVWGEATLFDAADHPTRLVDLKPVSFHVGWGTFSLNHGPDNKPLRIGNRPLSHGLFAHADSEVVYDLGGKYTRFETWVGINHTAGTRGRVNFRAEDGERARLRARYAAVKQQLTPERLAGARQSVEHLLAAGRGQADRLAAGQEALARLAGDLNAIREGLEKGSVDAVAKGEAGLRIIDDLLREVLTATLDTPLLFVKRHAYHSAHIYDEYLTWHPGGGIYIIENPWEPQSQQQVRPVIDPSTPETLGQGVYSDPDISWDGRRVLFAFKGSGDGNTAIYEIGVNGKGLRQVTRPGADRRSCPLAPGTIGKGWHDVSPCYLPDGRIAFTSTRTAAHVMCFSSHIDTLHTMRADGSDLRCISVNNQNEFDPAVMPDGRILYGRWEYIDKTALYMQSLWTVNPDGSGERALFANNLAKPTALLDARPVPGSRQVVAALTPHNGQSVGAIAMIDPDQSKNGLSAITNLTPEYPVRMDQGLKQGPCDPWPLSSDAVLVANNAPQLGPHGVIELIDRHGGRLVIHREPDISCYSPMLVKPRPRPPVLASSIQPDAPGRFLVSDIYRGMGDVAPGSVKQLRVVETTARLSGIPKGGRWWNQAFLVSWQGSYDVKRFLGVVPVADDGSAFFEAPAGKALYFQALDANGRLVQSQRTFVQAVPGITRSCVGCHVADDDAAPANRGIPQAARVAPHKLQPEVWGTGFLDYPSTVQPVLDRNCVVCHGGDRGIAGGIDLSGGWTWAFNLSYETLLKNTLTGFLNCNNGSVRTAEILPPRTHGSAVAPLAELLASGHDGRLKDMPPADRALLMAWMDGNCNYYGTWDYSDFATCDAIFGVRKGLLAEMKKAGCLQCHQNEIGNDWVNLRTPKRSRILRAPLAPGGEGLGLGWCRKRRAAALDYAVIRNQQPPDVFAPRRRPAPNLKGEPVTPFADAGNGSYRAMLGVIQAGRKAALARARVDMPGARIHKGVCRELPPLAPPAAGGQLGSR